MLAAKLWLVVVFVAALACGRAERNDDGQNTVIVSVAISLSSVFDEIASDYKHIHGTRIVFNRSGSDTLATQIIEGVPVDLFISADQAQMDRVARHGRVQPDTRVDLVANQLVIIVPPDRTGSVTGVADLRLTRVRRIVMGDPTAVPAGVYAKAYLDTIGLWDEIQTKVVPTRDVRSALTVIETGSADAGFVYRTDVASTTDVSVVFEVPVDEGPQIRYSAALTTDAEHEAAARQFLDYLRRPVAARRFVQHRFILLDAESLLMREGASRSGF